MVVLIFKFNRTSSLIKKLLFEQVVMGANSTNKLIRNKDISLVWFYLICTCETNLSPCTNLFLPLDRIVMSYLISFIGEAY
jgi:hypothetical protein